MEIDGPAPDGGRHVIRGGDDMVQSDGEGGLGSIELTADPSGAKLVKLTGEIDISNAEAIGAELERLVGTDARHLVVDMSALEFIDSSGIAMLLQAAARVDSIAMRDPSSVVRRLIEATGLTGTLPIEAPVARLRPETPG